jgi:RNA 2',3'-cyclic 3'-phosphodiesterase
MRLFIATSFPEAAMAPLHFRVARVRPRLPPASWVRPETQHLTFAFLGEHPESLLARLAPLLETSLRTTPSFDGQLRGCGFFPNPRHARVGWVGASPHERFEAVAHAVREAVGNAGVTLDGGDFRPHLTVMRIREHWPPMSIETFERELRDFVSELFRVDHVTLYSSKLSQNGAVHTALQEFALA